MLSKSNYNGIQDETVKEMKGHLKVLNHDSQTMQVDIAVIKERVSGIEKIICSNKKILWIILTTIIGIALKIVFFNGGIGY